MNTKSRRFWKITDSPRPFSSDRTLKVEITAKHGRFTHGQEVKRIIEEYLDDRSVYEVVMER